MGLSNNAYHNLYSCSWVMRVFLSDTYFLLIAILNVLIIFIIEVLLPHVPGAVHTVHHVQGIMSSIFPSRV